MRTVQYAARRKLRDPQFWADSSTLSAIASATVAVLGWLGLAVALGVAAGVALCVRLLVARNQHSRVSRMFDDVRARFSTSDILYDAGTSLGLSERHPLWRITLYKLHEESFEWTPRARAAADPQLMVQRGDSPLNSRQGILRGPVARCDMPVGVPDISPVLQAGVADRTTWLEAQDAWGISRDRAARMRMTSRCYWGQCYRVRRRGGESSILGLVVESESDRPFTPGAFDSFFGRPFFEAIDAVLAAEEGLATIESDLESA